MMIMSDTNVQANPAEQLNIIGGLVSLFDRPQHMKNVEPVEFAGQRRVTAAENENTPISQDGSDSHEPDAGDGDYDLD